MVDEYKKQLFDDEFGRKDSYGLFKLGIVFFLLVVLIVGSVFIHFKNIEVQEKQAQQQEYQRQIQAYYYQQQVEQYQQQQKLLQEQQAQYQRELDRYNQSIAGIAPTPTPIVPIQIH